MSNTFAGQCKMGIGRKPTDKSTHGVMRAFIGNFKVFSIAYFSRYVVLLNILVVLVHYVFPYISMKRS